MIRKMIVCKNYDGVEYTEEAFFNLSKAKVMKLSVDDEFEKKLKKITGPNSDGKSIINFFEELLLMSYGKKSDDGIHFEQSSKISEEFENTQAYSELLLELVTHADIAADFLNELLGSHATELVSKLEEAYERNKLAAENKS